MTCKLKLYHHSNYVKDNLDSKRPITVPCVEHQHMVMAHLLFEILAFGVKLRLNTYEGGQT